MDIQPYVLRYWETEFEALAPGKSKSGQRVYSEQELGVIRRIKELLYDEGYTIAGAKKRLQAELEEGRPFAVPEADGDPFDAEVGAGDEPPTEFLAPAGDDEPSAGDALDHGSVATVEVGEPEEASAPPEERQAEAGVAVVTAPPPAPGAPASDVAEASSDPPVAVARPSRRRKPSVEAKAAAPAVDSALSNRIETLENGVRRVLAEIRHLRGLLADSSGDR